MCRIRANSNTMSACFLCHVDLVIIYNVIFFKLVEKLGHLAESIEREKKRLHDEHSQLKSDSKLSISRISANVSGLFVFHIKKLLHLCVIV